MPRVKSSVASRKRRKKILKAAKGYWGGRGNLIRSATEAVHRAWAYSYRDRKARKREFRRLWIARINAATRQEGLPYSRFMEGLKKANVQLDRKTLSEMAIWDRDAFSELVSLAKHHIVQ